MALHIVNAAPGAQAISNCLHQLSSDDSVVLMGDATYAASTGNNTLHALKTTGAQLYALQDDARLRGVIDNVDDGINIIGLSEFVTLTEKSVVQLSWF